MLNFPPEDGEEEYRDCEVLRKRFAWYPIKLYNGAWKWWEDVYRRQIWTDEVVGLLETPPRVTEYYTPKEAMFMKLQGEKCD